MIRIRRFVILFLLVAAACSQAPKSPEGKAVMSQRECSHEADPHCAGGGRDMLQVPLPEGGSRPVEQKGSAGTEAITGSCVMVIEGDPGREATGPCYGVRLILEGSRKGQGKVYTADTNGYSFRFSGLPADSYRLRATSEVYEVQTDSDDVLSPGQTLKIRVRAKPRR